MKERNKSVTLIELIVAIVLLSVIVLGATSIDIFSRNQVLTSDRRAKIQNQAYYVLEHLSKNIARAIGNERINGTGSVVDIEYSASKTDKTRHLRVYIDANGNGMREAPKNNPTKDEDHWIDYRYGSSGGVIYIVAPATSYNLDYCSRCYDKTCSNCLDGYKTLRNNITSFVPAKPMVSASDKTLTDSFVTIDLKACFDPQKKTIKADCGTLDNPEINMRTRIKLPSVSTN